MKHRQKENRSSPEISPAAAVAPRLDDANPGPMDVSAKDHSAYSLYVREIGQVRLLSPEEEIALARRVQAGDPEARDQFIKANLRLVVKIARDFEGYGVPLLDLVSEGNVGLMKAVDRFDPERGAKFSTYAAWWIKQAVRRALTDQSKTVRLPSHVVDKLSLLNRATNRLREVLGREPTDEELSEEAGMDANRVRKYRNAGLGSTSLDAPLGDDDENRVADVVADEKAKTPFQELAESTETALVRRLVDKLEPREATILRRRFGLDGDVKNTLEEIGADFGVTRERIRQIEEIALKKLRREIEKLELAA